MIEINYEITLANSDTLDGNAKIVTKDYLKLILMIYLRHGY